MKRRVQGKKHGHRIVLADGRAVDVQDSYLARMRDPMGHRTKATPIRNVQGGYGALGRNDPCPCGSGLKVKRCTHDGQEVGGG